MDQLSALHYRTAVWQKTKHVCLQDIGLLYLAAFVIQCFILIPYLMKLSDHHQDVTHIVWRLLDMIIYAAPPGLPLILIVIGIAARSHLKKDGLTLLFPEMIKHAAEIDVVCFDKTGTLTHTSVRLRHSASLLLLAEPM